MAKKIYILDTNIYLSEFSSFLKFKNNDIVIPFKVLEEIDKHKTRQDSVGFNARQTIKLFDELRSRGTLNKGVRIEKGKGIATAVRYSDVDSLEPEFPPSWSLTDPDNQIIATALSVVRDNPGRKIIVVTRDINMRVKCDSVGLFTEDYALNQVVDSVSDVYTGFVEHLVDDQTIDQFYDNKEIFIDEDCKKVFYPNQFILLVSNANDKKTALAKFIDCNLPLKHVTEHKNVWGVQARNKEQGFALDLLLDPSVQLVSLVGKAGSGKTLCAIAAGLEQIMNGSQYTRLIVSRPIQPMGKDIGYLPGSLEEKMSPWLAPIQDNLRALLGNDKATLAEYMHNGTIELEALTYIRGRSISNAFIIIDEAQNLSSHEIKTIITRVGEGTKIILTGDVEQIDNAYVDETSNGLTHAVEKLKKFNETGHVTLMKGERSKLASIAAKNL
jgi:PhoH-like ATPase